MKTLTLRKLSRPLTRFLEERARQDKTSLTQATLHILEESAGLVKSPKKRYTDLDWMIGKWSKEEADAFDAALRDQRKIDPDMWK